MNIHNHRSESTSTSNKNQEISRIISAAVINVQFRSLLLNDPVSAITHGYGGEHFALKKEDQAKLGSIQAHSLAEFAARLSVI